MPTTSRDAQFLLRMLGMVCTGVALTILGALLNPARPNTKPPCREAPPLQEAP